jgi:dTDP-glucose 4,6-dehydratase
MTTFLVTGAAGFLGHHLVEHILKNTGWQVIGLDALSYASHGTRRLQHAEVEGRPIMNHPRFQLVTWDFTLPISPGVKEIAGEVDFIIHMGAETHVDRSIEDPRLFARTNVMGTVNMLEFARTLKGLKRFVYFSTDEVFGPAEEAEYFNEWSRYCSSNPYAASKAGAEEMCVAYENTYNLPVLITHAMNAFGERQHQEKFIPKTMRYVEEGWTLPIHSYPGCTKPGERGWIHARNMADAVLFLLEESYLPSLKANITPQAYLDNLTVAQEVARLMGRKLDYELVDFHSSRPGHDPRYALNGGLLRSLGWEAPIPFEEALKKTIQWELSNRGWDL